MSTADNNIDTAIALRKQGKLAQALTILDSISGQYSNQPGYYFQLGLTYYHLRQLDKAILAYQRNLQLAPDNKATLLNLGACYNELGQNPEAIACYEKVVANHPDTPSVWGNLAKAWHDHNEHETSIYCYRKALQFNRNPQNLRGLALAWRKVGRYDRSRELLEEALQINPDDERAHFGLAMNCLYQEEYEEGLKEFEWRLKLPKQLAFKAESLTLFAQPQYSGQDLNGKTLLVWTEQGFGDSLQFARFLPLARAKASKLVMWCRPGLGRLFNANFDIDQLSEDKNALPAHDYQISLMSLPRYFDPKLEQLSRFKPYLDSIEGDKAIIKPTANKRNIGLVWGAEQLGYEYANKKVPLDQLAPLFDIPGIAWHSLQVGADSNDLKTFAHAHKLQHQGDKLKDFADTARAIKDLDLIISVDTAVAHLAGAMGKPVWVMLHKNADWRWHSDNGVGRWYAKSKLIRQKNISDWTLILTNLLIALKDQLST